MRDRITPKVAVSVVFVAAMFMNIMDITIVNVALPAIGKDLHAAQESLGLVSIGFLVSLAVFIPASGWIGDRFGNRRVFLAALAIFTAASVLCAAASTFDQLVLYRVLQGVGGGLLTPVGTSMLMRAFPPAERVKASAILVLPTAVAPATGPLLGGFLVQHLSWHWVFLVNLPIGLLALAFGLVFLPDQNADRPGRFDVPGFVLAGGGLGLFMYGVSEGPLKGWGSAVVDTSIVLGIGLLVAMVVVERRVAHPMVDLDLFSTSLFRNSTWVVVSFSAALFGTVFLISLYLQAALGKTAQQTGLTTFTQAIGVMVGSQLATRWLYPRLGPRRLTTGALAVYVVLLASLFTVEPGVSLWWLRLQLFAIGLCMGNLFVPVQVAAFAAVPFQRTGQASALFNASRQLGGALGVALLNTILSEIGPFSRGGQPHLAAYRVSFLVAALVAAIGIPFALLLRDEDAAETYGASAGGAAGDRVPVVVGD